MGRFVPGIVAIAAVLGWGALAALPANAATYDVTFTGTGGSLDLSAVITTSNSLDSLGGYDITGVIGNVTGDVSGAISGLIANPGQPMQGTYTDPVTGLAWNYDNVLFTTSVPFDNNGILFSFGSDIVANLYSVGSAIYLSVSDPSSLWDPGVLGTLEVTATPLPAALPLFACGLLAMVLLGWRRKPKASFAGAV
jgi:hypothetical protein